MSLFVFTLSTRALISAWLKIFFGSFSPSKTCLYIKAKSLIINFPTSCPKCKGNLTIKDNLAKCNKCKLEFKKEHNVWDFRIE